MSDVIDLDVFVPEPRIIKIGEEEITINQPRTIDLIQLGLLTNKLTDAQEPTAEEVSDEKLQEIIDKLTARLCMVVPELEGKFLNKGQIQRLVTIISEMAMPREAKELEAEGITKDTAKKAP